jgi:hypothetical protein
MPNGIERHLFKVEHVLGAFRARYGVWPTQIRLHPIVFHTLKDRLLTERGFAKLAEKLEIIVREDGGIIATDDRGREVDIRTAGLDLKTAESARQWLGLEPTDLLPEEGV